MVNRIYLKPITEKLWFALLIIYIITGYFAQDVLLPASINSTILYVFLAYSLIAIAFSGKIILTPILWWEISFLFVSLIAMFYSPTFALLDGTYYVLLVNFVIVFILTQMPWNKKRLDLVMKSFVVSSAGLIIILALTGNLEDSSASGRLGQELTGNANILGMMLMVGAIYGMWIIVASNSIRTKFFSLISVIIIYYGMFLSGGRKFVIVPIVFLYVLLMHKKDKKGRKHLILYTLLVFAILLLLYNLLINVTFLYDIIGHRFKEFLSLFNETGEVDSSTLLRNKMIAAAWEKWPESPLVGYGFDSFKYYNASSVTGNFYYSHNNFVELLYNQGIIGFLVYYSFYFYIVFSVYKLNRNSIYKGLALGIVFSWLSFEYFGVSYSSNPTQIMMFFAFYCLRLDSNVEGKNE